MVSPPIVNGTSAWPVVNLGNSQIGFNGISNRYPVLDANGNPVVHQYAGISMLDASSGFVQLFYDRSDVIMSYLVDMWAQMKLTPKEVQTGLYVVDGSTGLVRVNNPLNTVTILG